MADDGVIDLEEETPDQQIRRLHAENAELQKRLADHVEMSYDLYNVSKLGRKGRIQTGSENH